VLQLTGGVSITLDDVQCSADSAVVWLTPAPGGLLEEQQADIVLAGNAKLSARRDHLTRTAPTLLVNTIVRGSIDLTCANKLSENLSQTPLYLEAKTVRDTAGVSDEGPSQPPANAPLTTTAPPPPPAEGGTSVSGLIQPAPTKSGFIHAKSALAQEITVGDGSKALELSGGISIWQTSNNGDFLELYADTAILFLSDRSGLPTSGSGSFFGNVRATAGYLEGDVRVIFTPAAARHSEQHLTADRVYYDFKTQEAVLTDVVFHSIDPTTQIPFTIRAQSMKQIAHNEFSAQHAEFTTSKFAVPTYSIRSSYAYIHQESEDKTDYDVITHDDVLRAEGVPVFYWPALSGTVSSKPLPIQNFSTGNSSRDGFTVNTQWGLFETLGEKPPKDLNITYRLDYWSLRGFGGGFDGAYRGGFITDSDEPWSFQGDFQSFLMSDHGVDQLGGVRLEVTPPTELRGKFLWEHEQFFPDDWQVQVRAGYASDPTFLEEWYQSEFDNSLPYDAEFYAKRQKDTEVLTFLATTDTTRFITNADRQQEQFDIARLPEITYQRVGDSVVDDNLTYFGNTQGAALKFLTSDYTLEQQGFYPGLSPGQPSDGYTGTTNAYVFRGDTRQEIDYPIAIGQFKVVPYVMGHVTAYSDSVPGDEQTRLYGGTGLRLTTSFWRVDDSIDSDLLNLHRVRHVVQPEVNFFTSGTTVDASKLFIFDPNIDAITDITGVQVALHQHWNTMRGGPGRWQSVDFLDFNLEGDFYPHQPPPAFLNPLSFRGLFFASQPETSVPRQALLADVTWHIGDDTAVISDVQWDIDKRETSIAEIGVAVNRGSRLSYYLGDAYIQALESQVFSFNATYNLTAKYSLTLNQSLDFGSSKAVVTSFTLIRRFDVFAFAVSVYHDGINNISGFNINLFPSGQPGFSTPWRAND
jgi:hypothetical protein